MARTIIAHVNIEIPDDSTFTPDEVANELQGVLEVGIDPDHSPILAASEVTIPMAEEV